MNKVNVLVLCLFLLFISGCVYSGDKASNNDNADVNSNSNVGVSSSQVNNIVVNVDDAGAVSNFLTSKTFTNADGGLSIKFYPEGYYELKHNYELAVTGKYTVGERKYDSSIMLYLESDQGNLTMMLSTDGKIMDKASLRIFN